MTLDRRDFTKLFAAGVAALALPDGARALAHRRQQTFFTWRPVADGVHAAMGQGGNVMLVRDGGQALISDSKNFGYGYVLRREAEALGAPLTHSVNTHHHGDHVGGNIAFTADLPLIAHPLARARVLASAEGTAGQENERLNRTIAQLREEGGSPTVIADLERLAAEIQGVGPERLAPNRDMPDSAEIRVGGLTVHLRHVGPGHTDNDVFLYIPRLNVLHTGDLLFVGRHGFMDQNGGVSSVGWQRSVRVMIELIDGETVVIPGHGDITNRAGLQRQWDYFGQLRDAVEVAVAQGMSKEEVTALEPPALADIGGSPARNLGVVYDEVTGAGGVGG